MKYVTLTLAIIGGTLGLLSIGAFGFLWALSTGDAPGYPLDWYKNMIPPLVLAVAVLAVASGAVMWYRPRFGALLALIAVLLGSVVVLLASTLQPAFNIACWALLTSPLTAAAILALLGRRAEQPPRGRADREHSGTLAGPSDGVV